MDVQADSWGENTIREIFGERSWRFCVGTLQEDKNRYLYTLKHASMLKEIAYWTYRFLSTSKRYKKEGGAVFDSVMFVSTGLTFNIISIIYIVEYYTQFTILKHIPITTRWDLMSWIVAALILLPFEWFVRTRWFKQPKLSRLMEEYAAKSKARLRLGRVFYFVYCILTVAGPFVVIECFKH